jgi:hypothetical protein
LYEYDCAKVDEYISSDELKIGDNAFSGCSMLRSINIPIHAIEIGEGAFSNCGIERLTFSNGSALKRVGRVAFSGITGLTSVDFPKSLVEIGNYAFQNCTGLTKVEIDRDVKSIGDGAFDGCTSLKTVGFDMYPTLEKIGDNAFNGCVNLTNIGAGPSTGTGAMPATLWYVGKNAFSGATKLARFELSNKYGWLRTLGNVTDDRASDGESEAFTPDTMSDAAAVATMIRNDYVAYAWYRITQTVTPEIDITGDILTITDPVGIAQTFKIWVGGKHWATVNVKDSTVELVNG